MGRLGLRSRHPLPSTSFSTSTLVLPIGIAPVTGFPEQRRSHKWVSCNLRLAKILASLLSQGQAKFSLFSRVLVHRQTSLSVDEGLKEKTGAVRVALDSARLVLKDVGSIGANRPS